jgi:hypothetical protein
VRSILAVLAAAAVAVSAAACAAQSHDVRPAGGHVSYVIQGASPARALVAGYPTGAGEQPARFALHGDDGRTLWAASADTANFQPGGGGVVLAAITPHADRSGWWGTTRVCSIDASGHSLVLGEWPHSNAVPLHAGPGRFCYAVSDHRRTRVCVRSGRTTDVLTLHLPGPIRSWTASGDGARIALVVPGMSVSTSAIVWVRVSPDGRPRLVGAPVVSVNTYVALSPDGSSAVLGGPRPLVTRFGSGSGRPLPLQFVSKAQAARGRTFVMRFWSTGEAQHQRGVVLDDAGKILWERRLSGSDPVINVDPGVRFAAYRADPDARWTFQDLATGAHAQLDAGYADVTPTRGGGYLAVDKAGRVVIGDAPFGGRS